MSVKVNFNELELGLRRPPTGDGWRSIDWQTITVNKDTETITIVPVDESQEAIVINYTDSNLTAELP